MTIHNVVQQLRAVACALIPDSEIGNNLSHAVHTEIVRYLTKHEESLELTGSCESLPFVPSDVWEECDPTTEQAIEMQAQLLTLLSLVASINAQLGNKLLQVEYSINCIRNEVGHRLKYESKSDDEDDEDEYTFDCIRCGDTRTKNEYYSHGICDYCAHVTR